MTILGAVSIAILNLEGVVDSVVFLGAQCIILPHSYQFSSNLLVTIEKETLFLFLVRSNSANEEATSNPK